MVIVPTQTIERIIPRNPTKFSMKSKAKDFRSWLIAQRGKATLKRDVETEMIFGEVKRALDYYNPERVEEIEVPRWKGKSSLEIIEEPNRYLIIKYQKVKDGEPQKVITEVSREEMSCLKQSIVNLWSGGSSNIFTTDEVLKEYSRKMGLDYRDWNSSMFTKRTFHNKFTKMLGALAQKEFINYSGGKITKL